MISQLAQVLLTLQVPLQYHFAIDAANHGPTEQEIATCAYLIWELEGRPPGRDKIHWEQAQAQLIACQEHERWLSSWDAFFHGLSLAQAKSAHSKLSCTPAGAVLY